MRPHKDGCMQPATSSVISHSISHYCKHSLRLRKKREGSRQERCPRGRSNKVTPHVVRAEVEARVYSCPPNSAPRKEKPGVPQAPNPFLCGELTLSLNVHKSNTFPIRPCHSVMGSMETPQTAPHAVPFRTWGDFCIVLLSRVIISDSKKNS